MIFCRGVSNSFIEYEKVGVSMLIPTFSYLAFLFLVACMSGKYRGETYLQRLSNA